jgi:flagellar protein FlaF
MYRAAYSEITADDCSEARRREGDIFDTIIARLAAARAGSPEQRDALDRLESFWGFLLRDLAHPANALDETFRARLVSIGLWVLKDISRVRLGLASADALIDVNRMIREGLR